LPEVRWATLDPFGSVRAALAGRASGRLQVEMRTTGNGVHPDSDAALIAQGFATLTMIAGVQDCPHPPDGIGEGAPRVEREVASVPSDTTPVHITAVGTAEPRTDLADD